MPGGAVPDLRSRPSAGIVVALTATLFALTASAATLGHFSAMSAGADFGDDWRVTTLSDVEPTRFELVTVDGRTVVQARAQGAAASLARAVQQPVDDTARLHWRWRIDRVVENSDIATKQGDDFAARLYVFFDFPLDRLSLVESTKLRLARWWYGDQVPAAALCYVWANREPPGTRTWNAYTSRARMIVLRNAAEGVGEWADEMRPLAADFREAFGDVIPVVTGIALAADTDQTGENVTAWFGDIGISR